MHAGRKEADKAAGQYVVVPECKNYNMCDVIKKVKKMKKYC